MRGISHGEFTGNTLTYVSRAQGHACPHTCATTHVCRCLSLPRGTPLSRARQARSHVCGACPCTRVCCVCLCWGGWGGCTWGVMLAPRPPPCTPPPPGGSRGAASPTPPPDRSPFRATPPHLVSNLISDELYFPSLRKIRPIDPPAPLGRYLNPARRLCRRCPTEPPDPRSPPHPRIRPHIPPDPAPHPPDPSPPRHSWGPPRDLNPSLPSPPFGSLGTPRTPSPSRHPGEPPGTPKLPPQHPGLPPSARALVLPSILIPHPRLLPAPRAHPPHP